MRIIDKHTVDPTINLFEIDTNLFPIKYLDKNNKTEIYLYDESTGYYINIFDDQYMVLSYDADRAFDDYDLLKSRIAYSVDFDIVIA